MKGNKMYISKDYRSLYKSNCYCLRNSIINALGELFILTGMEIFSIDRKNAIKIGDDEFIGVCIKEGYLHFVVTNDKDTRDIRIYDKQKDKSFKQFDSDINNWISFMEKIQDEFNNGLIT